MRVVSLSLALLCCACGAREPSGESSQREPSPTMPPFAVGGELVGTPLSNAFTLTDQCIGWVDSVARRFEGANPGVEIVGWGWDARNNAGFEQVVVVDSAGVISGAGQGGGSRPDVSAAVDTVTSEMVGFSALSTTTAGEVEVYGVNRATSSACRVGSIGTSQ